MFVRITFFEIKTELFPHLWHLCCPLWVFKNGWPVLVFPPHICKSLSLLVLWRHQPGPGPLNQVVYLRADLLVPHEHQFPAPKPSSTRGLVVWSSLSFTETQKLLGQTSAPGQALPLSRGPILLFSLPPTDQKKIVFIFLSELFFLRGTFHFIGHFFVLRHFCNLPSYNLQLELSWHHSPAYTKFLCVSLAEHPSFHVVHVFLM